MKIIHRHPHKGQRKEALRRLHTACLRTLRTHERSAPELPPASVRGR